MPISESTLLAIDASRCLVAADTVAFEPSAEARTTRLPGPAALHNSLDDVVVRIVPGDSQARRMFDPNVGDVPNHHGKTAVRHHHGPADVIHRMDQSHAPHDDRGIIVERRELQVAESTQELGSVGIHVEHRSGAVMKKGAGAVG